MNQNYTSKVASHFSYETPCLCCKNQGIRVKINFTANMNIFLENDNFKGKTKHYQINLGNVKCRINHER